MFKSMRIHRSWLMYVAYCFCLSLVACKDNGVPARRGAGSLVLDSSDPWVGVVGSSIQTASRLSVRDGVRRVHSGADEHPKPVAVLDELQRIGRSEGTTPDVFGHIEAIAVNADGNVYVLDRFAKHVVVFTATGEFSHVVGRKGAGPGELSDPVGIVIDDVGHLWVVDPGNGRYSVYDGDGRFLRSYVRTLASYALPWQGSVKSGDSISELLLQMNRAPEIVQMGPSEDGLAQVAVSSQTLPAYESPYFELRRAGSVTRASVPYSPLRPVRIYRDGVWFGLSDTYRLLHLNSAGDTTLIIEHEFDPLRVTAAEKQEAINDLEWFVKQGGRVTASRIPDVKPAFATFFVGDRGYLWVVPTTATEDVAFDVFTPDGYYLGRVRSPTIITLNPPPVIRGTRIYAAGRSASQAPIVVVMDVTSAN